MTIFTWLTQRTKPVKYVDLPIGNGFLLHIEEHPDGKSVIIETICVGTRDEHAAQHRLNSGNGPVKIRSLCYV